MSRQRSPQITQTNIRVTSSFMEVAGRVLKAQWEIHGWSIEEVARRAGMRKSTLERVEGGDMFTKLGKLADLCELYNLRPSDLC